MIRFKIPPDSVFQAILRESIKYAINVMSDVLQVYNQDDAVAKQELMRLFPEITRVFPPSLAVASLINLQRCLDSSRLYACKEHHYLLLYDVLHFYIDIHNGLVMKSRNTRERKEASLVDPYSIEKINADELLDLYFFDEDFLLDAETLLDLPDCLRESMQPEVFGLSQGLLPHPEELQLKPASEEERRGYQITPSQLFGPNSKAYPDYNWYERNHPVQ